MSKHYSVVRIYRSLVHFMLGKVVSAIAGLCAVFLVIHTLSIQAFAEYSILIAFVELFSAVSGLGLTHALLRYVPELYEKNYRISLRYFVFGSLILRTTILCLASIVVFLFSNNIAQYIGLNNAVLAFQLFLLVVILRSTAHFLSQILESTLHQNLMQISFTIGLLVRCAGMFYLYQRENVQLFDVINIEIISDGLTLFIMFLSLIKVLFPLNSIDVVEDKIWLKENIRRIIQFAFSGYVQHLAILPYGGHANRLMAGSMLSSVLVANYGFAQTLYEYMKRYMPAQLLFGLIRPVVIARYSQHKDFSVAARLCEQTFQMNLLSIGFVVIFFAVGGIEIFDIISSSAYGVDAFNIFCILVIVLVLETSRQQIELLIQIVDNYHFLIIPNLLLSLSILGAVALVPILGSAIVFPIANAIGLVLANSWVLFLLYSKGFKYSANWFERLKGLFAIAFAIFIGLVLRYENINWYWATGIAITLYGAIVFVFCRESIINFVREFVGSHSSVLPTIEQNISSSATNLKIAFGVLSSKLSTHAIDEIAIAVFPHPVYVHHDFSKCADFFPQASNVHVLKNPTKTAWGDWSLVAATFLLMEKVLEDSEITHFQLLSEACLPVRSIQEFEAYLLKESPDAMIDMVALQEDDKHLFLSHGWRYIYKSKIEYHILRKLHYYVFLKCKFLPAHSINIKLETEYVSIRQFVSRWVLLNWISLSKRTVLDYGIKQFAIGSQWFGVNRKTMIWLLKAKSECKGITNHFQQSHIPDESYIHTLFLNAQLAKLPLHIRPSNHIVFWKNNGTGPDELSEEQFDDIIKSGKFFARKFSLKSNDTLRHVVQNKIK